MRKSQWGIEVTEHRKRQKVQRKIGDNNDRDREKEEKKVIKYSELTDIQLPLYLVQKINQKEEEKDQEKLKLKLEMKQEIKIELVVERRVEEQRSVELQYRINKK